MIYEDYLNLAKEAAILAGEKIMNIYNASEDIGFESKNDNSPLTIADKKSHTTIIDILSKTNINILSEESEKIDYEVRKNWDEYWLIDPLDGTKEFIKKHKKPCYDVDMIGFLPGFLYLGGLNNSLSLPRKKVPRKIIPKGSIGIAENQTGIYNIESPGGWNIIGRTPYELFNKNSEPPIKIKQGDTITFYEVKINEFNRIINL